MAAPSDADRARFTRQTGPPEDREIRLQFNPTSLQFTVANTLREQSTGNRGGGQRKQFVSQSTGKLTMDLTFDTTDTGADVRTHTDRLARLMEPTGEGADKTPPVVTFEWGAYVFTGMVDTYKETLDFFSAEGMPLRAALNLGLVRQDRVFEPTAGSGAPDTRGALEPETVAVPVGDRGSAADLGARAGDPRAGAAIAAANRQPSMRFARGPVLAVSGSVSLRGPAAFASGAAGGGLGIGGGAGAGLSLGVGASLGAGIGAGAGGGLAVGGAASAGVAASAGAFAGVRGGARASASATLDPRRLVPRAESVALATDGGATFRADGRAEIGGAASLRADVGASADLKARLDFGD